MALKTARARPSLSDASQCGGGTPFTPIPRRRPVLERLSTKKAQISTKADHQPMRHAAEFLVAS